MFAFSKLINNIKSDNNEAPKKRDKDYYIKLLNNIYSNDSHLSSKNAIKNNIKKRNSNVIKTYDQKDIINGPKPRKDKNNFKFECQSTKQKLSIFSQDLNCGENKKMNDLDNCIKDGEVTKKQSSLSKEQSLKKIVSEKSISKFKVKNGLKIKKKEFKRKNSKDFKEEE